MDLAPVGCSPRLRSVLPRTLPLAALLGLAACVPAADRGAGSPPPTGGVLVIATPSDADVLFPPASSSLASRNVTDRLFPRLAELTLSLNTLDDSGFVPSLAARWEHRDSVTLVFELDPRARWQDGLPVTADDVLYTFGVYRDPGLASPYRANLIEIDSVTRVGSTGVAFHFRRRYPEQLYDATYHLRVLPRHLLDTIPPARLASSAFARAPVGIGPFRFVRWTAGTEIVLEADTASFLGRPHLDRIVWRVMPDVSSAVTALIAGEADAMEVIPQKDEIERAEASPDLRLVPYPSPFLALVMFNLRRPPFQDRGVRRALAMAVDRATIVRAVFGPFAEVPIGATSRMQWIAGGAVRQMPFDTTAASRAFDSLGWRGRARDGTRLRGGRPLRFTLLVPTSSRVRQQAAVLLQAQLRTAGVDMQIQPLDFSVLEQRTARGDFDAVFLSRTLDASPSTLVADWSSQGLGGVNYGGYASPAFDALVRRAVAAPGRDAALPLYHAALEQLNDDAAAIFVFSPRNNAAIHRRYEHVTIRPDSWLATVSAWSVPADRRLPRDAAGRVAR